MTLRNLSGKWPVAALACALLCSYSTAGEADPKDPYYRDPDSAAKTEAEMKPYKQGLRDTDVVFEMLPIPGGVFTMGSADSEEKRVDDEGPQHPVKIEPFWMGKCEVTWDEYDTWRMNLDIQRRKLAGRPEDQVDELADGVTRPTKEYTDMTFGMGHDGFPVICMTQLAAKMYCQWLSEKTGHYYRLPTEAEWEYACRAGTTTPYYFGADAADIDEHAWHYGNSEEVYHKVGQKKPNPWGLYDMHGNVAEWTLDRYDPKFYEQFKGDTPAVFPYCVPNGEEYPRIVRGGSWYDDPEFLRSAARMASTPDWKIQDPQLPQSMWYLTDADFVGFRIIRPLTRPSDEQIEKLVLYPDVPEALKEE